MAETLPLILVPGLLCTGEVWRPQMAALADLARPQATMEHTAHGSMAEIAAAILDKAPDRFALAGFSMGGYVAFEILRQAKERVDRLALIDTGARADPPAQSARRRDLMALSRRGHFKGVTPKLLPLLIHPARLEDRALVETITGMAHEVGAEGFLRQQEAILGRVDSRADLAYIRCPTLVLCGADDVLTPPELAREMAEGIRGAELVLVPACGHVSTLERPEAVIEAMRRWLTA